MLDNFINAILTTMLVSIPESLVWLIATLILLKRFDLLDTYRWKQNAKWIMLPVLSTSIVINILRFAIDSHRLIIGLIAILTIYIGIIIILKSPENNIFNEKIPYLKVFSLVLVNFVILIVLVESLYIPLFIKYFGKSILEINNMWSISFLVSIPARVIQFVIIIFMLSIQNRKVYANILQSIFYDKKISFIIITFITTLAIFWTLLIDIFGNYNIVSQIHLNVQILFSVMLLLVPSLLLVLMISLVILFIEKINKLNKSHQNMFDDMIDDDININR